MRFLMVKKAKPVPLGIRIAVSSIPCYQARVRDVNDMSPPPFIWKNITATVTLSMREAMP
jgi:hypothetical protein